MMLILIHSKQIMIDSNQVEKEFEKQISYMNIILSRYILSNNKLKENKLRSKELIKNFKFFLQQRFNINEELITEHIIYDRE
jgi:hypothetical protein